MDISIVQGQVDFKALKNSGVEFVIIRCGVGNNGIDAKYTTNVAKAKAAGLKVMAYHFIFPLPPLASQPLRDPIKQAQYHFNAAQGELAACDYEWPEPQDRVKWGCTADQMNQWCLDYLQEYERLSGRKMVIYTYPYFAYTGNFPPAFAQYPLWIASYATSPSIPHPWTSYVLWQNTGGGGRLPTTGVPVDTDLAKDLSLWDTVVNPPPVEVLPIHQPDPLPVPLTLPTIVITGDPPPPPVVKPSAKPGFLLYVWQEFMKFFEEDRV